MKTASNEDVLRWLLSGVFVVNPDKGDVIKIESKLGSNYKLKARINRRNRSDIGDPRVDLYYEGKRKSCHVSNLVWMSRTGSIVPEGFEIHHIDEDPTNNNWNNLICVHSMDHVKLHNEESVPF